jgi:protein TonB
VSFRTYLSERPLIDYIGPQNRQLTRAKYQRYFGIAFALTIVLLFSSMLSSMAISAWRKRAAEAHAQTRQVKLVPYRDIAAPPSLAQAPVEPPKFSFKAPTFKAPPTGIPVPVPKEESEVTTIASQAQIPFAGTEGDTGLGSDLSEGVPWGAEGGGDLVIQEDVLPSPDEFVAVEEQPVLIEKQPPVYPELAQMAKIEGTVLVRVLVGKDGKVKDAIISKGVNGILDQAALDAAKGYVFKPAMQNKKPVAVWVAIPFKFQLY